MDRVTKGLVLVSFMEEVVLDALREAQAEQEELGPIVIGRRTGLIPSQTGKTDSKLVNAILGQLERKGSIRRVGQGMGRWVLANE